MSRRILVALFVVFTLIEATSNAFPQDAPAFVVRCASSMEKMMRNSFKEEWVRKDVDDSVRISACRNESESFQIVVIPFRDLQNLTWTVQSEIAREHIKVQPVGYVKVSAPSGLRPAGYPDEKIRAGWWPDPLFGTWDKIEKVEADQLQPIWVTVDVPSDLAAGDYEIVVTLGADGTNEAKCTANLKVWNFALPETPTLRTTFWWADYQLAEYYAADYDEELVTRFLKLALDHRITPVNYRLLGGRTSITLETETNTYTFDFGAVKPLLSFIFDENERKGNVVNVDDHGIAYGMSTWNLKVKEEGQVRPYKKSFGLSSQTEEYENFLNQYYTAWAEFLKDNGWFDKACSNFIDEPNQASWERVKWIYPILKRNIPEIKTHSAVNYMPSVRELDKELEIMAPGLFSIFTPSNLEYWLNVQKDGKELWAYICGKTSQIDYQSIDHRILFWLCWRYELKGFLYWGIHNWVAAMWRPEQKAAREQLLRQDAKERWPHEARWEPVLVSGDGYLIYPSPEGDPWSSIRLENIRDGIEDYEYFAMLRENLRKLKDQGDRYADILREGEKLLTVGEDIIQSPVEYSREWDKLVERRERVGDLIERIAEILRGETQR